MKAIYIGDELHRRAKMRATEIGLPLKELIETWVQQGLCGISSEAPGLLRESVAVYETPAPVETLPQAPRVRSAEAEAVLEGLERRGVLASGEQLRELFQAEYLTLHKILGVTTPPPAEPPSIEEVRAIFQRQRALHPEVPSLTELLRQMREEE